MKRPFREYKIVRTCTKEYKRYRSYIKYLKEDFKCRCAYCNLLETQITTPYEVDHFVPENVFKEEWPELKTTYENLVYSCKKCNIAKGNQYKGDIKKGIIENEYFYDPEKTDYATIFYRGDDGGIYSDDKKGRNMINRLKLYRPIHNLAWICETTKSTLDKLCVQIEIVGENTEKGKMLIEAEKKLKDYYIQCRDIFIANYNNDKFTM